MSTNVSTMELRTKLGEVLDRAYYRHEEFIIERKGRPLAAIISIEQCEQWQRRDSRFDESLSRIRERFADLYTEEVENLVDEAVVVAVRRENRTTDAGK